MSDKPISKSRRGAIKTVLGGLVTVPLMNLVGMTAAQAENLPHLDEADPVAAQLKYKHDAESEESKRKEVTPPDANPPAEERFCSNCMLQQPITEGEWVPCQLFPGKAVNAKGWCASWTPRPGV